MTKVQNKVFDIQGINHLALVCKDMARTVDFYTNVLGMPLVKTLICPAVAVSISSLTLAMATRSPSSGSRMLRKRSPGVSSAANLPMAGPITSGHGSMNHVAFNVPAEKFDEYYEKLIARGIEVTKIMKPRRLRTSDQPGRHFAHDLRAFGLFLRSGRHLPGIRVVDPRTRSQDRCDA